MKRTLAWRLAAVFSRNSAPVFLPIPMPVLLAMVSALLGACDRLAGTEVGNPEITVAARFAVRDTDASVSIEGMDLKVMGMVCRTADHEGAIWDDPNGHRVDFMEGGTSLPTATMRDGAFTGAELTLQADAGAPTFPDSVDFEAWSDPRYIKLTKVMGLDTVRAAFQLESGMRIKLGFTSATIGTWRRAGNLSVTVLFDGGRWAAGLESDAALTYRVDGKHARYVVIAPGENPAVYAVLQALLPESFMADSATME